MTLNSELALIRRIFVANGWPRPKRRCRWTPAEDALLRRLYPRIRAKALARRLHRPVLAIYQRAQGLGLRGRPFRNPNLAELGAAHRFPRGHVPANKGLRRPGYAPGRMRETQFKKGELAGAAQAKWVPVGTEVLDDEGYLKRKISDDRTKASRFNWRYVHTMTWETKHGLVPRGFAVAFKNGDRADIREENLELVSRQELMRRNSVHNLPKALAEVIQLRGALVRQIRKRATA